MSLHAKMGRNCRAKTHKRTHVRVALARGDSTSSLGFRMRAWQRLSLPLPRPSDLRSRTTADRGSLSFLKFSFCSSRIFALSHVVMALSRMLLKDRRLTGSPSLVLRWTSDTDLVPACSSCVVKFFCQRGLQRRGGRNSSRQAHFII